MRNSLLVLLALTLIAGLAAAPAAADEIGKKADAVVQSNAASIVTLRIVLDFEVAGRSQEQRLEGRGVIVAGTGLIMAPLTAIAPNVNARGPGGRKLKIKITPADIKVVFEQDEKEHDAFVVVKDSKRGLVFLQLKDFKATDRLIQVTDFSTSVKPQIGDQVVTVLRLAKGFDYATCFAVGRVIGKVKKPRKALITDRSSVVGLPVFTMDGKLIGCHGRMKSGITEGRGNNRNAGQAVIFNAKEINGIIQQAIKKADEGEPDDDDDDDDEGEEKEEAAKKEAPKKTDG